MSDLSTPTPVTVPLLNPNEPEGLLVALHVRNGQPVRRGDPLFTLETTKSTADVEAEQEGYVIGLQMEEGRQVRAGEIFCYLAASPDQAPPAATTITAASQAAHTPVLSVPAGQQVPEGLRITRPALAFARTLGIDLSLLPKDRLVTEALLKAIAPASAAPAQGEAGRRPKARHDPAALDAEKPTKPLDPTAIVIYGGGGHGKSILDLVRLLRVYHIVGVVDDGLLQGSQLMGLPVLGGVAALEGLHAQGVRLAVNAVGGISNLRTRLRVFEALAQAGFACPAVVHPSAVVEASAGLAAGVQVFAHAYVGSEARLGFGAIVNTGAILSHDCVLGDYANISPGAILAGEVKIGEGALVGMGATVNLQVQVGAHARIGNGATVKGDVPANAIVRAGSIWPA